MTGGLRTQEIGDYKAWMRSLNATKPRFLHTMVRVRNPVAAMGFYIDGLGMKLLGSFDVDERRVTAYFLGYEIGAAALELAHYWDTDEDCTHGTGYSHIGVGVLDVDDVYAKLAALGVESVMPPTMLVKGWPKVAFVKDPEGYKVQLVQILNE